jgi:hypothetical protein
MFVIFVVIVAVVIVVVLGSNPGLFTHWASALPLS